MELAKAFDETLARAFELQGADASNGYPWWIICLSLKINNTSEEITTEVKDGRLSIEKASTLLNWAIYWRWSFSPKAFQKSSMVKENIEQLINIITAMNEHKETAILATRVNAEKFLSLAFPEGVWTARTYLRLESPKAWTLHRGYLVASDPVASGCLLEDFSSKKRIYDIPELRGIHRLNRLESIRR